MSIKNPICLPEWEVYKITYDEYDTVPFDEQFPFNHYGFIYELEFKHNGEYYYYLGKKSFWSLKTLPPLKGQKKKRRSMVESNWKTYKGSSKEIPKDAELVGRYILDFADSKVHLTYLEVKHMFERDVLLSEYYYNKNILGKFYDNVARRAGEWIKWYEKGRE